MFHSFIFDSDKDTLGLYKVPWLKAVFLIIFLDELARLLQRWGLCRNGLVVTFDDGYSDCLLYLDLLNKRNISSQIFVVTDFIGMRGYLSEEQIRYILARFPRCKIGLHGKSHSPVSFLGEKFEGDLECALKILEGIGVELPVDYSFPHGIQSGIARKILEKNPGIGALFGSKQFALVKPDLVKGVFRRLESASFRQRVNSGLKTAWFSCRCGSSMLANDKSVGVILPTYNRQKETERALFSILSQTYQATMVCIVDDGSCPQFEMNELLRTYAES